jgi:hypothetical protein
MRTGPPAVVAALALPGALWLAWTLREPPPDWACGLPEPAGQDAEIADWRLGLGPAYAAATVLLAGLLARLSYERRRTEDVPTRPGLLTLVIVAPIVAFAVSTTFDPAALDATVGLATAMFFLAPFGLLCFLIVCGLAAFLPRSVAMDPAEMVVWCALPATLLVTGLIANAGTEQWCLD